MVLEAEITKQCLATLSTAIVPPPLLTVYSHHTKSPDVSGRSEDRARATGARMPLIVKAKSLQKKLQQDSAKLTLGPQRVDPPPCGSSAGAVSVGPCRTLCSLLPSHLRSVSSGVWRLLLKGPKGMP